jgi:ribonuclease BN (tRNA processing enzyme)
MAMIDSSGGPLRLTVLGCSTAVPHETTATSGYLVRWGDTSLLLDVGHGVIRNLQRVVDPRQLTAVVVGHMHADHYLDLVGLRYLYPWGERAPERLAVHLPPGGLGRLDALADAVSERPGFFDAAFRAVEFVPESELAVGELRVRFFEGQHYVPAWGVVVEAPDGTRLAYTGDTGPSSSVEDAIRDADLLLVESALASDRDDDPRRGHLTAPEAIAMAKSARVGSALLIHYGPERLAEIAASCEAAGSWVQPAIDGMTLTVRRSAISAERPSVRPTSVGDASPRPGSIDGTAPEASRA